MAADLEQRLIEFTGRLRAQQREHEAKAGYKGTHAERALLLDDVVVGLEEVLTGEPGPSSTERLARRLGGEE